MFNKRESQETGDHAPETATAKPADRPASPSRTGQTAVIGPSIEIDGQLKGDEDLVIEGRVKGTIQLRKHTLTIGGQGTVEAEVFAHAILVDGTVKGDLYASERISIRRTARIDGNILAPRISLEDGAKFRGSIDMDAESEAFRKAFGKSSTSAPTPVKSRNEGAADKTGSGSGGSSGAGSAAGGGHKAGGSAA